jgi:hypothetical protein
MPSGFTLTGIGSSRSAAALAAYPVTTIASLSSRALSSVTERIFPTIAPVPAATASALVRASAMAPAIARRFAAFSSASAKLSIFGL